MRKRASQSAAEAGNGNIASARETFAELYEEYLPKVFRYVSYRLHDTGVAEDLTASVFEKALERFTSYRADKASFSTWLFTIARNTVIDHYRTSRKKKTVSLDKAAKMAETKSSPEEEFARQEERQRLQVCLAALPTQEQDIVSLKFGSELTNRQIAQMIGLSESNVGTILYRTVRKLRDCFGGWQNG